jgi:glycosyltransferase involved in cell wall biosynthesis
MAGDLDFSLRSRVKNLVLQHRPDLVHVHSRRGADSFAGRAAQAAACPAILTRRVQSNEPRFWLRLKCRPYAAVVAISSAVDDELARAGIAPERRRRIVSAVDTELFRADPAARQRLLERFALPAQSLIAASAAQFIPRKGQDFLLRLAQRFANHTPPLQLLLFGQGPTRARLERRVAQLGLQRQVKFCGFVEDWPKLLPGLDLLLHPARREGLGSVVLEAMSAGVPVVASAVGGIVDAIESGHDGCLVPADALDVWQATVAGLLDDPALRGRLAAAARRRVEADFTIEAMTNRYLNLYRDIAG